MLTQKGCVFSPHVLGVQAGQAITIRNSDKFAHNVHSTPTLNRGFNFSQPTPDQEDERTFELREVMVPLKCDIHGWMNSHIGVVPHPYFAVTGEDGRFELKNLPPGDYTIEATHEYLDKQTTKVTLADQESTEIEFSFEDK